MASMPVCVIHSLPAAMSVKRCVEGFFFFFSVSKKINSRVFVCATLIDVYM